MKYYIWKNGKYIKSYMTKCLAEVAFEEVCAQSNPLEDLVELVTPKGKVLRKF